MKVKILMWVLTIAATLAANHYALYMYEFLTAPTTRPTDPVALAIVESLENDKEWKLQKWSDKHDTGYYSIEHYSSNLYLRPAYPFNLPYKYGLWVRIHDKKDPDYPYPFAPFAINWNDTAYIREKVNNKIKDLINEDKEKELNDILKKLHHWKECEPGKMQPIVDPTSTTAMQTYVAPMYVTPVLQFQATPIRVRQRIIGR